MQINMIACIAQDGGIGKGNDLLFHIREDMERFRTLTTGHTVIMGRKTFDSLPHGALPNRRNIVISHQNIQLENCWICHSLQEAIDLARLWGKDAFIMGGASIYEQAMSIATRLYLTQVEEKTPSADAFFPQITPKKWKIKEKTAKEGIDTKSGRILNFLFITYEKSKKL